MATQKEVNYRLRMILDKSRERWRQRYHPTIRVLGSVRIQRLLNSANPQEEWNKSTIDRQLRLGHRGENSPVFPNKDFFIQLANLEFLWCESLDRPYSVKEIIDIINEPHQEKKSNLQIVSLIKPTSYREQALFGANEKGGVATLEPPTQQVPSFLLPSHLAQTLNSLSPEEEQLLAEHLGQKFSPAKLNLYLQKVRNLGAIGRLVVEVFAAQGVNVNESRALDAAINELFELTLLNGDNDKRLLEGCVKGTVCVIPPVKIGAIAWGLRRYTGNDTYTPVFLRDLQDSQGCSNSNCFNEGE